MKYWVYILKSAKNGSYYVGYTKDMDNRMIEHNNGETKGNKYLRPFILVCVEEYDSKNDAMDREREIKAHKSHKYIDKLIGV